jgi:hypothetical protein
MNPNHEQQAAPTRIYKEGENKQETRANVNIPDNSMEFDCFDNLQSSPSCKRIGTYICAMVGHTNIIFTSVKFGDWN